LRHDESCCRIFDAILFQRIVEKNPAIPTNVLKCQIQIYTPGSRKGKDESEKEIRQTKKLTERETQAVSL
jgi:hypothetical protein